MPHLNVIGPVVAVGLILMAATTRGALAFHPPARLANLHHHGHKGANQARRVVVMPLSKSNESDEGSRLPFFARALQKLRKKDDNPDADPTPTGVPLENSDSKGGNIEVDSESAFLRALADRTRLEAEKMDLTLTLAKIDRIEGTKIPDEDERSNLLREAQSLMRKITAPKVESSSVDSTSKDNISNELPPDEPPSSQDESPTMSGNTQKDEKNIVQQILDGDKPLLGDDKRQDAIDGFTKLPQQIKDMMAKSVGMKDGTNATAVIEQLMAEKMLFEGDGDEKFSMIAKGGDIDNLDIFVDLNFAEINSFVENLLPEVTRKKPVKEEYIDALYSEVLGKDTFNPRERKPFAIPGGYLIRGESKVRSKEGIDDGDCLIEALDKKIDASSVAGKIKVCYILDPTPPSGEEIMAEIDETPVLLITNADTSPDTPVWVKPGVTFIGLASIVIFSLGSFAFNDDIVNSVSSASADSLDSSLDMLYDLSLPLAFSVLFIQIIHELGHLIVSVKDRFQIGFPTFVPSLQFGLTGAITPIKSSPKNIKSLFDFAIAGPLFGLCASIILLYMGLEMTVFMDSSAQQQLPSVPVEILRSSALGGGIIDYLLGDGVLNSPDPSQLIKLHPYAIAGFGGLIANALSLLPIGNTDGGRISISFFGRSFSRVVQGAALFLLVVAGFFGGDDVNILLCYAVFCQFWQKEAEIPCRNEVDELDSVRGFVAIGVALIVVLTLTPLA